MELLTPFTIVYFKLEISLSLNLKILDYESNFFLKKKTKEKAPKLL